MRRPYTSKKPKDMKYTISRMSGYLGNQRTKLILVVIAVAISVSGNLAGTYMIRPVVNGLLENGSRLQLMKGVLLTAVIYAVGVSATFAYTQLMARVSQRFVFDIRHDLFSHLETLPLSFFDRWKHGDIMSLFTNDIDTILCCFTESDRKMAEMILSGLR